MRFPSPRSRGAVRVCGWIAVLLALGCGSTGASDATHKPTEDDSEPSGEPAGPSEIEAPPMNVAANDARVRAPMDATPSPDGERVYYTALQRGEDGDDVPGIFTVDAGGGDIVTLAAGAPLAAPVGIAVSLDGSRLFVADAAAAVDDDAAGAGAILSLASGGGEPAVVEGTAGYAPRGLTIARVQGRERLYFTGRDPSTGRAGVFRVAPAGGNVEAVEQDAELHDPAGVAVAQDGDVYVIDTLAEHGLADVVRIRDGRAAAVLERIGAGFPAGIALTTDAASVLVSALDARTRRDRVYAIDSRSLAVAYIDEPFASFSEPAGLHRAHDKNVFAWADSEANDSGTVYVLTL